MDMRVEQELTDEYFRKVGVYESRGKITKHFKGDLYLIVDIAINTETGEEMVIYKALYGDCKVYARPFDMFVEECTDEQFKQYGQKYRFKKFEIESVKDK